MAYKPDDPNSWKNLPPDQKRDAIIIVLLVVVQAIPAVLSIDVEGPSVRGNIGVRMLTMLFGFEDEHVHIVSQPGIWLARILLVVLVGFIVWALRRPKRPA
jgi:hypothetical protein